MIHKSTASSNAISEWSCRENRKEETFSLVEIIDIVPYNLSDPRDDKANSDLRRADTDSSDRELKWGIFQFSPHSHRSDEGLRPCAFHWKRKFLSNFDCCSLEHSKSRHVSRREDGDTVSVVLCFT